MLRIGYRLGLLLATLLLLTISGSRQSSAQDELGLGQFEIQADAGYGGYTLPIANSELARQWAANRGLAWQVGMNYSTIPVFVQLLHRQPMARRAKVTVVSEYGYAQEELKPGASSAADEIPSPEISVSREVLVPPSVPISIALLPRACPPSRPGGLQRLKVKVEAEGLQQPITSEVKVIQLEPAHLYSLYLDGPPGEFYRDYVNQNNHLSLRLPVNAGGASGSGANKLLSSHLYTIGVPHRELTLAPLAARDFAFVVASLNQVRSWPQEDQQALLAFMLGGGRLCLFDASGEWQGLNLDSAAQPAGRGYLVAVGGDFNAARQAIVSWIEGELCELTLWCRGSVAGWQSTSLGPADDLGRQLNLNELFEVANSQDTIISHRPGFMHPLWVYREACFNGALEPWTYPEFATADPDVTANNRNLQALQVDSAATPPEPDEPNQPLPLMLCLGEARHWPWSLGWMALALPLVALLGGVQLKTRGLVLALAVMVLIGSAVAWYRAKPFKPPPLRNLLLDVDERLPLAVIRELTAARSGRLGDTELTLAGGSFVRRVSWDPPGPWSVASTDKAWSWQGHSTSDALTVLAETYAASPVSPVNVSARRINDRNLEVTVDTSGLASQAECYLLTPLGWVTIPGNQSNYRIYMALPSIPEWPGLERFQAWEARLETWLPDSGRRGASTEWRTQQLLRYVQQRYSPDQDSRADNLRNPNAANRAGATQLAWLALTQNPTELRGLLHDQGVLLVPLDPASVVGGDSSQTSAFMRLTFDLDGAP